MRCTQLMGLTEGALNFLDENVEQVPAIVCDDCSKVITTQMKVVDTEDAGHVGMSNDGPILRHFQLKDGSIVKEVIQASPWSSGPCIFICLEKEDGTRMFEWSQKDIDNA